jgi:hypothetical protein
MRSGKGERLARRGVLGARRVLWLLVVALQVGCQSLTSAVAAAPGVYLSVHVALPDGDGSGPLPAVPLLVTGPDGVERMLTRSEHLAEAPAGRYRVVAGDVWLDGVRYVASPGEYRFELTDGAAITLPIAYAPPLASGAYYEVPVTELRPRAATFHVDCEAGDDGASGLSPAEPWRTLAPVAAARLAPGDRLLLRRGCTWTGPLRVPWQGSADWPVGIGAYGQGARPAIRDSSANHVDVTGAHLVIEQLQAYTTPGTVPTDPGCADQPVAWRTGFTINRGATHVTLRDSLAFGNTAGVHIHREARFNHVLHNELRDNVLMSVNTDDGGSDDSGAWGVVVNGDDNEIAYNAFSGNVAWCSYDFDGEGASIEVYEGSRNFVHNNVSIDDTTFSELGGSQTTKATDNVFAYNRYASVLPNSQFLIVTGADDRFGPTPGTRALNNTVYLPHPDRTQGVVCHAGCTPDLLELRNNLLWVGWKALFTDGAFAESNNLFWRADGRPFVQFFATGMSPTSVVDDPRFVDADGGDFRLRPGSPAIDAGANLDLGIEVDVMGVPIPRNGVVDIGAHEHDPE